MKYALLLYADEAVTPAFDSPEMQAEMAEWFTFDDRIREHGEMLGGEALHPVDAATTVKVRDSKVVTSDGPFAETKEALGGFYLIDVPDLDTAIKLASQIPNISYGTVEIRPIMDFSEQQ